MKILAWPAFSSLDNPYTCLLASSLQRRGHDVADFRNPWRARSHSPQIVHIHWPDQVFWRARTMTDALREAVGLLRTLRQLRRRGARVVWTVHNIFPHDSSLTRKLFWKIFMTFYTRSVDVWICLARATEELVKREMPALRRKRCFVIPHGHFLDFYPNVVGREEARERLSIPADSSVILFFGAVRPYKNVAQLVRLFLALPNAGDLHLVVAGRPNTKALADELLSLAAGEDAIRLHLDFVPDDEIQVFMNAADLVVLPFKEILNSSSAMLGLSFRRPVLIPDRGAMPELERIFGPGWVRTYDGELTAEALQSAVLWARLGERDGPAALAALGWDRIAERTLEAYAYALSGQEPVGEIAARPGSVQRV